MTERICPRCGSPQGPESESSLVFCWNCGLPQVLISEELRDQFAEQERAAEVSGASGAPAASPAPAPETVVWRGAILAAGVAGGIAAGLTLISLALPPVVLFSWLWAVGAPVVALGLYSARFRATRISPGFGARLGLLCGLAISLAMISVNTVHLLFSRYVFHGSAQLDAQFATFFTQVNAGMVARSGAEAAAPFLKLLVIPEFRVGILLSSMGASLAGYLLFSAAGGAFAGLLRARHSTR